MPTLIPDSVTFSNTAISGGTINDILVRPGVSIVGTGSSGTGLGGTGNEQSFTVLGTVYGEFAGVGMGALPAYGNGLSIAPGAFVGAAMAGDSAGVRFLGGGVVSNAGTVSGVIGIVTGGSDDTGVILNSGLITGAAKGVSRYGTSTNDIRLINTGTIQSADYAYDAMTDNAVDLIRNHGTIIGTVDLGPGDDLFDGRRGFTGGDVVMGDGNDTVMPGMEVEAFVGGAGTDTIVFRGSGAVALALDGTFAATGAAAGDSYAGFERIQGSVGGDDTLRGDGAGNTLWGYGGRDSLDGSSGNDTLLGGAGRDTLTGGSGNDTFRFESVSEGIDTITDFANATGNNDVLAFTAVTFGGLPLGALAASRFQIRADNLAQDADDRFIFRTTDRSVWYDSDGSGAAGPMHIATLSGSATITAADFLIV